MHVCLRHLWAEVYNSGRTNLCSASLILTEISYASGKGCRPYRHYCSHNSSMERNYYKELLKKKPVSSHC